MNPFHIIGKLVPDDSDLGDLARRLFSLVITGLVVGGLIAGVVFAGAMWGEYQTRRGLSIVVPDTAANKVEYYRGVFDVCRAYETREWCVGLVKHAIRENWYETESLDWSWTDYK